MHKQSVTVEDSKILQKIMAALDAIGRQLDAADHIRDYDPWSTISGLESEIKRLVVLLSEQFSGKHADLIKCLISPTGLYLAWGVLKDEIEHSIA